MARGVRAVSGVLAWSGVAAVVAASACSVDAVGEGPSLVRCAAPEECPAPPDACSFAVCQSGFCYTEPGADGPTVTQTPGDCAVASCQAGTLASLPDPTDAADAEPCTIDTCTDAGPSHQPAPEGTPCETLASQNGTCVAGVCTVACDDDDDCMPGPCQTAVCDVNICDYSVVTGDPTSPVPDPRGDCQEPACTAGMLGSAFDDMDLPPDQGPCVTEGCALGSPTFAFVPAGPAPGCPIGCDGMGVCLECLSDLDCPVGEHCEANICYACDNLVMDPGETGVDCGDPVCGDCLGAICTVGTTCHSGNCVDARCCQTAMCGECENCLTGSCIDVPDNMVDPDTCVAPNMCEGGSCTTG